MEKTKLPSFQLKLKQSRSGSVQRHSLCNTFSSCCQSAKPAPAEHPNIFNEPSRLAPKSETARAFSQGAGGSRFGKLSVLAEGEGLEPPSPFGRWFSRPVQ